MPHQILPAWPDAMRYVHDDGHTLLLDVRGPGEPPLVAVPAESRWQASQPEWARPLRGLVIERLRAAGCAVAEQVIDANGESIRLRSADGRWRLMHHAALDERGCPMGRLQVWQQQPESRLLLQLDDYLELDALRFEPTGLSVTLTDRHGRRRRVQMDLAEGRFRQPPDDAQGQPLASLGPTLFPPPETAVAAPVPLAPRGWRAVLADVGSVVGGLLFVAASLWMALATDQASERWIGAFGVLFFGACALLPWWESRQRQRHPAEPAER